MRTPLPGGAVDPPGHLGRQHGHLFLLRRKVLAQCAQRRLEGADERTHVVAPFGGDQERNGEEDEHGGFPSCHFRH